MKKTGFSLIEVLMVMGIIGVVTAMGISISQKGVEKAYRNYWYTAYKALSDATLDAGMNNHLSTATAYQHHLSTLLKLDSNGVAPNGVKFTFIGYAIGVTIPSPNTKNMTGSMTAFAYDTTKGVLYPQDVNLVPNAINLQDRVDILPFVINNGLPGNNNGMHLYSYKEAYCMTHNNQSIGNMQTTLRLICPSNGQVSSGGVMQLVDPKKVY